MPWPHTKPRLPALIDEIFNARATILVVLNEATTLQRFHASHSLSKPHLDASTFLYDRLRRSWESIDPELSSLDKHTPQLILLQ